MTLLNAKQFGFDFFLTGKKAVKDLAQSAIEYGGATLNKVTGEMYSNFEDNEFIEVGESGNELALFVPDTVGVNTQIDSELYVKRVISMLNQEGYKNITAQEALGTWYSEDLDEVVYDNITIVKTSVDRISTVDIHYFAELGRAIKQMMRQENVTVTVNGSLCLV